MQSMPTSGDQGRARGCAKTEVGRERLHGDGPRQTQPQRPGCPVTTTDEDSAMTTVVHQPTCRALRVNQANSESDCGSQSWEPVSLHKRENAGVLWGPPV